MQSSKKLISIILIGIIVSIFVAGTAIAYSHNIDLNPGSQELNVIVSGSMEPVMYRGDIVLVDNSPDEVEVGDIIIYNAKWFNNPVIHRVISTGISSNGKTYYITKGDNNPVADPVPVYREDIISKVVIGDNGPVVLPKIGYLAIWIRGL